MTPRPLAVIALVVAAAAPALAQTVPSRPDDRQKTLRMVRVATAPKIDGLLDDPAWRAAVPDSRFTQNFPDEAREPTERTTVYVVYDDKALYVGVRCDDRTPDKIVEQLTRRDRDTSADKVTVMIDSRNDHTSAYHFDVNVSGVIADGLRFNDTDYNGDWDGIWAGVPHRDERGWSVEIEIPWKTLRFSGGSPTMGFQVRRTIQRRGEIDEWAYVPRQVRGEVSRYGHLVGAASLGPARLWQVWPYLSSRLAMRTHAGAEDGVRIQPNVGVDMKVGLTSSLTLDTTINPDFGQVEADQVQLNLTTFELFFPEKRPFFLEGVDLFSTPIRQFYTRRIGRPPPYPRVGDNEELVELPEVGQIWGAAKLTGQIVPHLSIAAINAVTAGQSATVRRVEDGKLDTGRFADPVANYAILRLRGDWGNSYAGITATAVNRFEGPGAAARHPDWCPNELYPAPYEFSGVPPSYIGRTITDNIAVNRPPPFANIPAGRCTRDAYTAGADVRLLTKDANWAMTAQLVMSKVVDGPAHARPDGTRLLPGDTGWGLRVQAGKQGGERVLAGLDYWSYSPTLELNDAGYLRSANQHHVEGVVTLRSTTAIGPTRETALDLFTYHDFDWTGVRLTNGFGFWAWTRLHSFWQLAVFAGYNFDFWDNREGRDGALVARKGGWWAGAFVNSDRRKRVIFTLNTETGRKQRGLYHFSRVNLVVRPVSQLEVEIIPNLNYSYGDPRWYDTLADEDGARVYHFGDLDSISFDVTFRGIYTFTPRLTLQAYAQVFVASGHYDHFTRARGGGHRPELPFAGFYGARCAYDVAAGAPCDPELTPDFREGTVNLNVVLRWEYLPGSTLTAVYTRSQFQSDYQPGEGPGRLQLAPFRVGPAVDVLLVKLSYLWG